MRVVTRECARSLLRSMWRRARGIPPTSWSIWYMLGVGCLAVVLVSCHTLAPAPPDLPPPATERRLLPGLPTSSVPASATTAEQQHAFAAAEALLSRGQRLQARQAFADFVRRYPTSDLTADALLALGHIAATLDQHEQALTYYRALIERFPHAGRVPEAYLGLGVALYHKQDYASSVTALRQSLTLTPSGEGRGLAHYYLGAVALKQQRYAEAIPELKAAQETSRDPAVVQQARDDLSTAVRGPLPLAELAALARQYEKTYPGELLLERLGQEYRKTNNQKAEADALRRLLAAFPQAVSAPAAQARLRSLQAALPVERVTMGVLLPMSGAGARAGTRALRAIELAQAIAQERYPALNISLAVRDASQSTATAQEALRTLVREERVIGVIGPLLSRMATELAPLAGELGVPIISPYARDSVFPALSPYALRNSLTDALQGRFLADYALDVLKLRRFVIVHPEDPYGMALREQFRTHVLQRQGEIVAVVSYPTKQANFRRLLAPLKGLHYDAIFLPEYADRVGAVVAQLTADSLSKDVQLLGSDGWNASDLVARGGKLLEGAIFVDSFFVDAATPTVHTFVEQFRKRYQETPDLLAAQAYDTFLMCAQVLAEGAQTPAQLRDGLVQVRDFDGVSGRTSMRHTGDAEKTLYVLTVKNGQIVQLEGTGTR